jgi:hypothetical protein
MRTKLSTMPRKARLVAAIAIGLTACGGTTPVPSDGGADASAGNDGGPNQASVAIRQLRAGPNIEEPRFAVVGGEPSVIYYLRETAATSTKGGTREVRIVRWTDGVGDHSLIKGASDRREWPADTDASGARLFVTDEHKLPNDLTAGTLNRVKLDGALIESIDDVVSYVLSSDRKLFYYRKYLPGSAATELHLHDLTGRDRALGKLTGRVVWSNETTLLFMAGDEGALTRVAGIDGSPEILHPGVSRFLSNGRFAAVTEVAAGVVRDLVMDLQEPKKAARPVSVGNSCCWIKMTSSEFVFGEHAPVGGSAKLHFMNLESGVDRSVRLGQGMLDVAFVVNRPASTQLVVGDSMNHIAVIDGETLVWGQGGARSFQFTPDGKQLVLVVAGPAQPDFLFLQDARDWTRPRQLVSPKGTGTITAGGFVGTATTLLYVYGANAAKTPWYDLHATDVETGAGQLIARETFHTTISGDQSLILNNATGNPPTGDLLYRHLSTGHESYIDRGGIVTTAVFEQQIAYVVREVDPGALRNGLWAAPYPARVGD